MRHTGMYVVELGVSIGKGAGAYADFLKGGYFCDHTQTTPTFKNNHY